MLWIYLIICPVNHGPISASYLASKSAYPSFYSAAMAGNKSKNFKKGCVIQPMKQEKSVNTTVADTRVKQEDK